jgi:hypothetical protein
MFGSYEGKSSVCDYLLFLPLEKNLGGHKFKEPRGKTAETEWMLIQDKRTNREFRLTIR